MIINDRRLSSLINRDAISYSYTRDATTITGNCLIHRRKVSTGKTGTTDERDEGTALVDPIRLLIRIADGFENLTPEEGEKITVQSNTYRITACERSSDQTHLIITIGDEYI